MNSSLFLGRKGRNLLFLCESRDQINFDRGPVYDPYLLFLAGRSKSIL